MKTENVKIVDPVSKSANLNQAMSFHPGVFEYQKRCLLKLMKMADILQMRGMRVMEIGGNGTMAVAKTLSNWSGNRVTVVTPDPELHSNSINDQMCDLVLRGAEDTGIASNSFDLIFGGAILEHVLDYEGMFRECYRLLRPGGRLLLQGGPHWFSQFGHHVFVVNREMDYRFSGNNPVPDFGHLYLSKEEMSEELCHRGLPVSHSQAITQQIYNSPSLNRAYVEDILKAVKSFSWSNIEIVQEDSEKPEPEILRKIESKRDSVRNRGFVKSLFIAARI